MHDSARARGTRLLVVAWLALSACASVAEGVRIEALAAAPSGATSCPEPDGPAAFGEAHAYSLTEQWWRVEALDEWDADVAPVLLVHFTFFGEVFARLPGEASYRYRSPLPPARSAGWPGDMAVFDIADGLAAGDEIVVCVRQLAHAHPRPQVLSETRARTEVLARTRIEAITEGTVLAMTLAALGMSLALRSRTFLTLTGGLALAFVYVIATNGSLVELPGTARLMRDWPLQRIGGIGSTMLVGLGLTWFIGLPERNPSLWIGFRLLMLALAAMLLISLLPTPLRFAPIGTWSNLLMVGMIVIIVGSATAGVLKRHRPSRLMLVAWTPAFITVTWLAVAMPRDPELATTLQWLLPATLVLACASLFMGLAERFASVRAERDTATLLAETDELTGALSRLALDRLLERLVARARRNGQPFSVLFIDFDHFKRINDDHGHATGDRALKVAVDTMFAALRDNDRVGRYGGEEFVVTLEGVGAERAREVAERIRTDIENDGKPLTDDVPPMTVSIGIAGYEPESDEPLHSLLARADHALLTTKRNGRNRVELVAA